MFSLSAKNAQTTPEIDKINAKKMENHGLSSSLNRKVIPKIRRKTPIINTRRAANFRGILDFLNM